MNDFLTLFDATDTIWSRSCTCWRTQTQNLPGCCWNRYDSLLVSRVSSIKVPRHKLSFSLYIDFVCIQWSNHTFLQHFCHKKSCNRLMYVQYFDTVTLETRIENGSSYRVHQRNDGSFLPEEAAFGRWCPTKLLVQRCRHSCLSLCSSQIYDNAMITAGLNDDPRPMISRLNDLLTKAMEKHWEPSSHELYRLMIFQSRRPGNRRASRS